MVAGAIARIPEMDSKSRREWMRGWIALGLREGLTYAELARRSGLSSKTIARWNKTLLMEREALEEEAGGDRPFVELLERASSKSSRIEIILRGDRRVVLDGSALVEALVRFLTTVEQC